MDLRDYYSKPRIGKKGASRSDVATSWRQKRGLSSNFETGQLAAFQEPITKKGKPLSNTFQKNDSKNNSIYPSNNAFQNNKGFQNIASQNNCNLLSSGFTVHSNHNNNAQTEYAWKRLNPLDRIGSPPGLPSPLMLPPPIVPQSSVYPNEVSTDSRSPVADNSFFGHNQSFMPTNVLPFFQQHENSVPDYKILQPKDNNQYQAYQLFSSHPYSQGLQQKPINDKSALAIKTGPLDTENKCGKTTWSKVVAGERPSANNLLPTPNAFQPNDQVVEDGMGYYKNIIPSTPTKLSQSMLPLAKPGSGASRYLTDSISYITSNMEYSNSNENGSVKRPYTVVKITNIPWSVDSEDIKKALDHHPNISTPPESALAQCIHVMMDVKSGKTLGTGFAEVIISPGVDKQKALDSVTFLPVQGRRIRFMESSYDALCKDVFSDWNGDFKDGLAIPSSDSTGENEKQLFITQKDLQYLLNVCRQYKVHYNRKCPDRPFEYLITLIMCIPWKQPRAVTTIQRDIVYECYKLATEALRLHTSKSLQSFNSGILLRLVISATLCDGFTVKQKNGILTNSQLECPPDLKCYLQEPLVLSDPVYSAFMT